MKKRLLSGLLVLCLIFSLLPVSAFADEATASGTCGDDLTWTLQDGALTISGTGDMEDYNEFDKLPPWIDYAASITEVVIGEGVTSIGSDAFITCALTDVTIPGNVKSIGYMPFAFCSSLTQIKLSEGIETISDQAFNYCTALTDITIPSTVKSIGQYPFDNSSLITEINVSEDNAWYSSSDGVLFNKDMTTLIAYPQGKEGAYVIPEGVTTIEKLAFADCKKLTSVSIPEGVTTIAEDTFVNCSGLTTVKMPVSVTSIGISAFSCCHGLSIVYYGGTSEQWDAIKIESYNEKLENATKHFYVPPIEGTCGDDLTWILQDGTLTISGEGKMDGYYDSDFAPWYDEAESIVTLKIEYGVTSIGESAFNNCRNITSVTIPTSVTRIESFAFQDCENISDVYYGGTSGQWDEIYIEECNTPLTEANIHCDGTDVPPSGDDLTWTLEDGTLTISGEGDMKDYSSSEPAPWYGEVETIEEIEIEDGVTSIGSYAFAGCTSLSQITIPTSVSRIGTSAFYNCGELSVVWYGGSDEQWDELSVGSGNDDLLYDTEICFNCVQKCGDDLTWTLKNGTLTISGNGDMYDYSWSSAPWYNESGSIVNVVIKDGVTSIGTYAFIECSNLKSVSIPASVTSIGDGAFEECWSLDEVHYSGTTENWSAITVGDNNGRLKLVDVVCSNGTIIAPDYCGEDVTWTLENGVLTISGTGEMDNYYDGNGIPWYDDAESIVKVVVEDGVTSIGESAFLGCKNLKSVELPSSIESINYGAFSGCSSLSEINYGGTAKEYKQIFIGSYNGALGSATVHCEDGDITYATWKLENGTLTISGTGDMFDYGWFGTPWHSEAESIEKVVVEDGVTSIAAAAFVECKNVQSVTIPQSVVYIGLDAIGCCSALKDIYYDGTVAQWDDITVLDFSLTNRSVTVHCNDDSVLTSSYCGDNVKWTLDENGTLTITGTGDMYSYEEGRYTPWYDQSESVTSIVIEEGVTSIGVYAFLGCANAKSVSIPNTVTAIEREAFFGCKSLKEVVLPEGVKTVSNMTFVWCDSLESVTVPSTLESFGGANIYRGVFYKCQNLKNITVSDNNAVYSSDDGVVFSKDKSEIVLYPEGREAAEYQIPSGVTFISYHAFMGCNRLQSVTVPDSVTEIGQNAFYDSTSLESITIPDSVRSIGDSAFYNCSALKDVYYGGFNLQWKDIYQDDDLDNATIHFRDPMELQASGTCGDDLKWKLEKCVLTIYGTGDMYDYESLDPQPWAKYEEAIVNVVIEDGVTSIGWYAFNECSKLESISIPDSVTRIEGYAFRECINLNNITLPDGLEYIGYGVFSECSSIKSIVIPANVTTIKSHMFENCSNLESITFMDGVEEFEDYVFSGCVKLAVINVSEGNSAFSSEDGVLFSKDKNELVVYPAGKNEDTYSIPTSVTSISYNAFLNCMSLKNVIIPDGVKSIGYGAFSSCSSLVSINIPSGVKSIGYGAFSSCSSLVSVNIPSGVKSIDTQTFEDCTSLVNVNISDGVRTIGFGAFGGCTSLASINIPASVTSIEESVFSGCISLKAINVDESNSVFSSADGVLFDKDKTKLIAYPSGKEASEYSIPDSVTSLGNESFVGNKQLVSIIIPDSVTELGYNVFRNCTSLEKVDLSKNIAYIDSYVFSNCKSLKSIVIPDGVTGIGYYSFSCCTSLESIIIPESLTYFDSGALYDCGALKNVYFKGTQEQWEQISIYDENYDLSNATIHYNYTDGHIHSYTAVVTEPTCTEEGYTTYTCECGDSYKDNYTNSLGHDVVHHDGKAPTCTESGYEAYETCSRCDYTTYKEIAKTGHQYVETVFVPTCTVKGYTTHTCSVCGDNYIDSYVDALGHDRIHHDGMAPTCTESGFEAYDTCSRCDYTTYKELAALGHDFGEWTVTTEPTCTEKGTETKSCSRCDATETREVAALGHDYEHGTCTRCGEKDPNYIAAPVIKITTSAGKPKISWSKVEGAVKYQVYRSTDGKKYDLLATTTGTSITNTKAKIGTKYYYKVKAVNAGAESEFSNVVSIKCVPAAPTVSISRSGGKAKLSWKAVSGATKYYVYRSTDGVEYKPYYTVSKTSFTDSKSASGKKYYYKVKAVTVVNGKAIVSGYSNVKSIFTSLAKPTVKITTVSGKPKLSWSKVTGADKYYVYRSTNGKDYTILIKTTKTSVTNTGAKKGTKYYYKVKAICSANANANSVFSAVVSIKATK